MNRPDGIRTLKLDHTDMLDRHISDLEYGSQVMEQYLDLGKVDFERGEAWLPALDSSLRRLTTLRDQVREHRTAHL